ncbi:MAG: hypothetical protein GC152_09650 [Alphaproteobacteria bacterium]|nr:hypothetical protein [Alphaproteobacteria bacterium]
MNRLFRTIKHEGEDALRFGGFMLIGALLAFSGVLAIAAAIVVGVSALAGLVWGLAAAALFAFAAASVCFVLAAQEEPVERKSPSQPEYSPLLKIVEDVASDLIAGVSGGGRSSESTKTLAAALAAGSLLGFIENSSKNRPGA